MSSILPSVVEINSLTDTIFCYKLSRYTELYQKYQGLFESKLETFLQIKNYTSDDFAKACQEVSQQQCTLSILVLSSLPIADGLARGVYFRPGRREGRGRREQRFPHFLPSFGGLLNLCTNDERSKGLPCRVALP